MKKVLILLAVLVAVVANAEAQKKQIFLGPSMLFKAGVNAGNIPDGSKTAMNFHAMPDLGLTFKYLFSKSSSVGAVLDVEYATYSFRMRPESESAANDNNTVIFQPSYISFAPSIFLSGVTLGAAFGFPSAFCVQNVAGDDFGAIAGTTDDLNSPFIEIRLGGMIRVLESDAGELNILIRGGYNVNGLYNADYFGSEAGADEFNPVLASGGIGVNWLFDLGDL